MKFNKSFLFATLIASTVALTACNEEKKAEQQPAQKQESAQVSAADQFNQAVQIAAVKRTIEKDAQGNESVAFTYEVKNVGNKAIKAIHWATGYSFNGQMLYAANLPLTFTDTVFAPQASFSITEKTAVNSIPEQFRATVLEPNNTIQANIGGVSVEFEDGSKIEVK